MIAAVLAAAVMLAAYYPHARRLDKDNAK